MELVPIHVWRLIHSLISRVRKSLPCGGSYRSCLLILTTMFIDDDWFAVLSPRLSWDLYRSNIAQRDGGREDRGNDWQRNREIEKATLCVCKGGRQWCWGLVGEGRTGSVYEYVCEYVYTNMSEYLRMHLWFSSERKRQRKITREKDGQAGRNLPSKVYPGFDPDLAYL